MSYDTITQTFTGTPSTTVRCWCSLEFVIPKPLYDYYLRKNESAPGSFALHCPLGHEFIPAGPSAADKLRDELAREKHRAEQARAHADALQRRVTVKDRQLAARKGQLTKLRRRVSRGVCPCCNRYFAALDAHMQQKHPDWHPEHDIPERETPAALSLLPPAGLGKYEQRAWRRGADAWRPDKHAINPYSRRGRGATLFRAWQAGLEAAREAAHG